MILTQDAFSGVSDLDRARQLFRTNVHYVEFETHSYCNRRCGYCPNVAGDRLGPNQRVDDALFDRVIGDLREIDFRGIIVLSNYNEPLSDPFIVTRIAQTRAALPHANIQIYTNGDYLTADLLDQLATAGLNYMHISIHMRPDDIYSDAYAIERMTEVCGRVGRGVKLGTLQPGAICAARIPHNSIQIEIRAVNYWRHGSNRGGSVENVAGPQTRMQACHYPFSRFTIGHSGRVVPCCEIRGDRPEHADNVIGQLRADEPIYLVYASAAAARWRRSMLGTRPRTGPCAHCPSGTLPSGSPLEKALIELGALYPPE